MSSTDDQLADATVTWLSALLDSADPSEIGPRNWWPRARAALETSAAAADTYAHAVAVACRKLQIDTLAPKSAAAVLELETTIAPELARWRELAQRDAVYLVAITQVTRAERKKKPAATVDLDTLTY